MYAENSQEYTKNVTKLVSQFAMTIGHKVSIRE